MGPAVIQTSHLPEGPAVYRVVNRITGDCYVGGSAQARKRGYQHARLLANGDHYNRAMLDSYRMHGAIAFGIEVLDLCEVAEISARETAWIERLKPAFNLQAKAGEIRLNVASRAVRPQRRKAVHAANRTRTEYVPSLGTITHDQRRERRLKMADAVRDGTLPATVAFDFNVSVATVLLAMKEFRVSATNAKRAELDARILELVRSGETASAAAASVGISISKACEICRRNGVRLHRGAPAGTPHQGFFSREAWESIDWTRTDAQIAQQLIVSRQRVHQVRHRLGKSKKSAVPA